MVIKINNQTIIDKINNNTLKAKELVSYVLEQTKGITQKAIDKTALKDIIIDNKPIKKVSIDTWEYKIIIEF